MAESLGRKLEESLDISAECLSESPLRTSMLELILLKTSCKPTDIRCIYHKTIYVYSAWALDWENLWEISVPTSTMSFCERSMSGCNEVDK